MCVCPPPVMPPASCPAPRVLRESGASMGLYHRGSHYLYGWFCRASIWMIGITISNRRSLWRKPFLGVAGGAEGVSSRARASAWCFGHRPEPKVCTLCSDSHPLRRMG